MCECSVFAIATVIAAKMMISVDVDVVNCTCGYRGSLCPCIQEGEGAMPVVSMPAWQAHQPSWPEAPPLAFQCVQP